MTSILPLIGWFAFVLSLIGGAFWLGGCADAPSIDVTPPARFGIVGATGSMEPLYRFADLVEIVPPSEHPFALLEVGNVVAIMRGNQIAAMHRLVYRGQTIDGATFFVSKGDANPTRDAAMVTIENYGGLARMVKKAPISP